jgi:hypothetical protein
MSRAEGYSFVRPLFYDALSGEFQPPSDELQRSHTLGRLAYEAYSIGLRIDRHADMKTFAYQPAWEPSVRASAVHDTYQDLLILRQLQLTHNQNWLTISSSFDGGSLEMARGDRGEANSEVRSSLTLELGEELDKTRNAVTQAAQDFFNLAVQL